MVCGATCEWKASECGAQWCAAQHANGKRQSAADNGARRGMRMESASARCTTERGAQWCAARQANGKRQNAAHNGVRRGKRMASVRTRRKRSVAQHANEKRQSAAHNGARRSMRMESASARCTTERNAVTAQSQRSENYARQCISAGACVPSPSAALEDAGWRARTGAALR